MSFITLVSEAVILVLILKWSFLLSGYMICWFASMYLKFRDYDTVHRGSNRFQDSHTTRPRSIRRLVDGLMLKMVKKTGFLPSQTIRLFIYRHVFFVNMGQGVVIYGGTELRRPHRITIGEGTIIGDSCVLDGRKGLSIGCHVNISSEARIWTEQHDVNDPSFGTAASSGAVSIGDRCWISSRSVVLPRTNVAEGCVLASGSVLTKSTEPFGVYGGIPARRIAERIHDLEYTFDGTFLPFY